VLHNVQVLNLGHELLVGVLARTTHHGVGHLLRLHLLGNLAGGYIVLVHGQGIARSGRLPLSLPRRNT
jgi:hypothetical protein